MDGEVLVFALKIRDDDIEGRLTARELRTLVSASSMRLQSIAAERRHFTAPEVL